MILTAITIVSFLLQIGTAAHHWDDMDCRVYDLGKNAVEFFDPENDQ